MAGGRSALDQSDLIGFTALGPPYIPVVIETIRQMRAAGLGQPILVGGEGINRLDPAHFARWFDGLGATQVRSDLQIAMACGILPPDLPSAYDTSMVPMLKRLGERERRRYLTSEIPLFTSQGCAFNCSFCAAAKGQREQYRTVESLADELEYICWYLARIGHRDLSMYLTNLDAFQTPGKFEERLQVIRRVCAKWGITPHARCLATTRCTFKACKADSGLLGRLRKCGLEIIAFGVDGADEEMWRQQNKTHNSLSETETICRMVEQARISLEILMVIGFPGSSWEALWHGLKFSVVQAMRGRSVRPYLAKAQTPAATWPADDPAVQQFLRDPDLLVRLDYAMVGSEQTHPRWSERWAANAVYLAIIGALMPLGKCPCSPLFPVSLGIKGRLANLANRIMPFDR